MGKSDSDKKKSSKLFKKKHKRFLIRLFLVIVLGGSVVAFWKPELIQDENQRNQVLGVRQSLAGITTSSQDMLNQRLQSLGKPTDATRSLPKSIVVGDQEIYVEETIQKIASDLETIPQEQYQVFRANFCADLVATMSATSN